MCAQAASANVQILIEGEAGAAFDGQRHLLTTNGSAQLVRGDWGDTRVQWMRPDGATTPALVGFIGRFLGPNGAPLQVGTYSNVSRLALGSPSATMEVSGSCNQLTGSFEVLDVAYDTDGTPLRLALNLEHHCENNPRTDRVRIRFNTAVPLHPPGVTANAGADVRGAPGAAVVLDATGSQSTFAGALSYTWSQVSGPAVVINNVNVAQPQVSLPSIPGEYAFATLAVTVRDSQGNEDIDEVTVIISALAPRSQLSITTPETGPVGRLDIVSDIDVSRLTLRRNFRNGIDLRYTGAITGYVFPPELSINWSGPLLSELRVGEYDLAYRNSFAPKSKSGLDFVFILGCGQLIGHFKVLDIAYDDLGRVERLAIDLTQFCGDEPNADQFVEASIRYNSVVPLVSRMPHASAGQDLEMFAGQTVSLFGMAASNGGASDIVEYRWRQTAGSPVALQNAQSGTGSFVAPNVPLGGDTLRFELTVRNSAGFEDADVVSVRVLGPQDGRSWIQLEQFASEGCSFLLSTCNGANITFTRNEGDLVLSSTDNGGDVREWVEVKYQDWGLSRFTMISEPGRLLEPGRIYLDLHRGALDKANVDVSIDARGCNHPRSTLTVHEIERDAQNKPISIAADFTVACDGDAPVYGWIRVNSTVPKTPSRPLASAGYDSQVVVGDTGRLTGANSFAGAGIASYQWTQVSGPPVTLVADGADATFTAPSTGGTLVFRLTVRGTDGSVHTDDVVITVPAAGTRRSRVLMESSSPEAIGFGRRHEMPVDALIRESNANTFWINHPWSSFPASMFNITIHAPFAQALGPTNYPGIRDVNRGRRPNHDIFNAPGMDFDWELFHCLDARGRFFVHEYVLDQTGKAERIAVDVIQSCGLDGPLTRAAIRMNSAVPLRTAGPSVSAGPDRVVRVGRSVVLDGRYSISWLDKDLTYSWTQVSGPAVQLSSQTAARPTFTAPATAQDTTLRFELTVTDEAGLSASDAVNVTILAPTTPSHDVRLQVGPRISIDKPRPKATGQDVVGPNLIEHTADDSYLEVVNSAPQLVLRYLGDVGVYFTLTASEMSNRRFQVGTWTQGQQAAEPRIEMGFDGLDPMQCMMPTGRRTLRISEVEYDASGEVTRLAFGYRIDCNDIVLTGVARFNSADASVSVPDHIQQSAPQPPPTQPPPTQPPTQPPAPPPSGGAGSGGSSGSGGGGASNLLLLAVLAMLLCFARRRDRVLPRT